MRHPPSTGLRQKPPGRKVPNRRDFPPWYARILYGVIYGAGIGAIGFGIAQAVSIPEGVADILWKFSMAVGFLLGGIAGEIIGGIIGAAHVEPAKSALLGGALGFLIAGFFMYVNRIADGGQVAVFQAALCAATGAGIGWMVAFRLHTPW